jgi:uncharacterized membrane-anchored protein
MSWAIASSAIVLVAAVQEPEVPEAQELEEQEEEALLTPEDVDAQFEWHTGTVTLGSGLATIELPPEYRYLDPRATKVVLEQLWGNPPADLTLGMVFPVDTPIVSDESWGVVLQFEDCGYVSDDDAAETDYDELLEDMQKATEDENEEREKAGYGSLEIIGWAARPSYDAAKHKLLWAKELQFSGAPVRTLNYDVRVLGRRGVLSMNAVASMDQLAEVESGMGALLDAVHFGDGHRYENFDSKLDEVAAFGIGGLIAGKLALKVGLFKGLLAALVAAKKLVIVAVAAIGAFLARTFRRKKVEAPTA